MNTKELEKLTKKQLIEIIKKNAEVSGKQEIDQYNKGYKEGYNSCCDDVHTILLGKIVYLDEEEKLTNNILKENRINTERAVIFSLMPKVKDLRHR